jgi:DNA-binding NtrC family response regulator
MEAYAWPGNVRELEHAVERAVILGDGPTLGAADFALGAAPSSGGAAFALERLHLDTLEQLAVRQALSKHGGNISRAAAELGISRKALYRRIEKYGL